MTYVTGEFFPMITYEPLVGLHSNKIIFKLIFFHTFIFSHIPYVPGPVGAIH